MRRYQMEKPRSHKPVVLSAPRIGCDVARLIGVETSISVAVALASDLVV